MFLPAIPGITLKVSINKLTIFEQIALFNRAGKNFKN